MHRQHRVQDYPQDKEATLNPIVWTIVALVYSNVPLQPPASFPSVLYWTEQAACEEYKASDDNKASIDDLVKALKEHSVDYDKIDTLCVQVAVPGH